MTSTEKIERVDELRVRIAESNALLLTDYRGLTVSDIRTLRRSLLEGGARFAVVKNTLMRRAASGADIADLESLLDGPTAVAFVAGDPVAAAKRVVEAAKAFPTLVLKGGYVEGRVLSADEARALADLDSREVMLSKVAGMLKGEMSRAAAMFVAAQSRFLSLLESYKEKVPAVTAPEAPQADGAEKPEGATEATSVELAPEAPEGPSSEPDESEDGTPKPVGPNEPQGLNKEE